MYWLLAIVALAIALRLARLGTFPYWHDEVHNLLASEDLYSTAIQGKLISNHPPLPYILAAGWRALGLGGSEWTMRLLPALFGVAAVPALFALARRLFDEKTGLIAAFLLAIAPLHVHHSQDLKEYIYLPFVACLIGLFLYKAVETNRWRDWFAYGALAGLGCYTEIFVGPLLIALNLWVLAQLPATPDRWKGWVGGNTLGALLFAPWLGIMIVKAIGTMVTAETWWIPPPSPTGVAFYVKAVAFGYTAPPVYKFAVALFTLLFAAGFAIAIVRRPREGWFLVAWFVIPVSIVYAISLRTESIFLIRAMIPYAIALYIAVAVAIAAIPMRNGRYTALTMVAAMSAIGLVYHYLRIYSPPEFPHRPGIHAPREYDLAAKFIGERWQDGDAVLHSDGSTWLPFFWYGLRDKPQFTVGVSQEYIHDITIGNPKNTDDPALESYLPREVQDAAKDARRLWFVFSAWERMYLEGSMTDVWSWLDSHYTEVAQESFSGIDLFLYMHPEDAPVIGRDRDNGVAADTTILGRRDSHHKVRPDNGFIPKSEFERQGKLLLRFVDSTGIMEPAKPGLSIAVENRAPAARSVEIIVLFSDYVIDAASLYEPDATEETWHVYFQHNPHEPPPNYRIPVASAHFDAPGSADLIGEANYPPGTYDTLLYLMGKPGDIRHSRAGLSFMVGDTDITETLRGTPDDVLQWQWYRGNPVTFPAHPVPMRLTATCTPDREPAYADVGYLALQRRDDAHPETGVVEPVVQTVTIGSGETFRYDAVLERPARRIDAWAYEREPGGMAYHIFRILESRETGPAPSLENHSLPSRDAP
jgi:hypothetical protein